MRKNLALCSEKNHLNYDDANRLQDSCKLFQENIDIAILVPNSEDFEARHILGDKEHLIMVRWVKSIEICRDIKFGSP